MIYPQLEYQFQDPLWLWARRERWSVENHTQVGFQSQLGFIPV